MAQFGTPVMLEARTDALSQPNALVTGSRSGELVALQWQKARSGAATIPRTKRELIARAARNARTNS